MVFTFRALFVLKFDRLRESFLLPTAPSDTRSAHIAYPQRSTLSGSSMWAPVTRPDTAFHTGALVPQKWKPSFTPNSLVVFKGS